MAKVITANPEHGENRSNFNNEESAKAATLRKLKDSQVNGRLLTGSISNIGQTVDNQDYVTLFFEGANIIIPFPKMGFSDYVMESRHKQTVAALGMAGCEVDFVVEQIDADHFAAVANRAKAMDWKANTFYIGDAEHPARVQPGSLVEARIVGVGAYSLRLEMLGVEKTVKGRRLRRQWISDCHDKYEVGNTIVVKVNAISRDEETGKVDVEVEGKDLDPDFVSSCKPGERYVGTVVGYNNGTYFLSLDEGSNAIAHATAANSYLPHNKDVVAFLCSRVMDDGQTAAGKITRVIRKNRTY